MKKAASLSAFTLGLAALVAPAFAAEDGALGAVSTGTIGVSGRIEGAPPQQVRVSGLDDIDLGVIEAGRGFGDRLCLYHTSPTFSLTATQVGGGGFRLIGANGAEIPYIVNAFLPVDSARFEPGVAVTGLVANTESETCANGQTSQIGATTDPERFPADAPTGVYSAVLSITMAAE